MKKTVVPFDSGNATIISEDEKSIQIVITSNGVKYEFYATPTGIEAFSIDGGKRTEYKKEIE